MRKKIPGILCVVALAAMAMVGALPAHADDSPTLERVYPTEESHVDPGTVTFQGRVSRGSNEKNINVVFAVDVSSGAAGSPGMDCNGDHIGGGDHLDDFNHDDGVGDILDCQIATVHSLTEHLRTLEGEDRRILSTSWHTQNMPSSGDEPQGRHLCQSFLLRVQCE